MVATWNPNRQVTNDHILPYIDSKDPNIPESSRQALHTLPFERNVFKLLLNSPLFGPKFMGMLSACFHPDKALRPSDWQLTVLLTSRILDAPYEWDVNWPVAKLLPTFHPLEQTEPKIAARDLSDEKLFSDRQRLIARFCEEVHGPLNRVGEATMNDLMAGGFDADQIMELFMITGIYGTLARMMVSAKVDYDPPIPGLDGILAKAFTKDIERDQKCLDVDREQHQ